MYGMLLSWCFHLIIKTVNCQQIFELINLRVDLAPHLAQQGQGGQHRRQHPAFCEHPGTQSKQRMFLISFYDVQNLKQANLDKQDAVF